MRPGRPQNNLCRLLQHLTGKCRSVWHYTVSGKKWPPKHVKITLWVESDSHYFSLYDEKPSICNDYVKFHDNWPVHCWDIAFCKKMIENCRLQHCQLTQAYCLLEGATDGGVVRLASQHHLCGSESVAYSSGSLRACWWRALWTSVMLWQQQQQ